ncbi:TonB-dependent receptor [Caulobacter sp. NIBR2454]|uniref:TonB-dependent receptor n=1 Tax=Caulobacter sp. NIBR2454 TaxID=3015996 RepID=UPI0022B60B6E|nr:TonB-dependent receptor [Caulobacter sp. NIBR2454]
MSKIHANVLPRLLLTASAAALLGIATSASAQAVETETQPTANPPSEVETSQIEEIVVTARRREERLQDVPVSITAFTADAIERRNMVSLSQVQNFTPNITFATTAPVGGSTSSASVFIRGIGQNDFAITTDPGVGIYLDGVYIARSVGGVLDLVDLERLEVLRGPQGTLFGRNTIGGAINVTTARPTAETGGWGELTYGEFNRVVARGSLNLPISDTLRTRLSASYKRADGYGSRPLAGDEMGDENSLSARFVAEWKPTDRFTALFSADGTHQRENGGVVSLTGVETAPNLLPLYNAVVLGPLFNDTFGPKFISSDRDVSLGTGPNVNNVDIWGVATTLAYDLGSVQLKSITAYRELDTTFGRDADGSPYAVGQSQQTITQNQFSQELQLAGTSFNDRLDWLVGAYYFEERATDRNHLDALGGLYATLESLPFALVPLATIPTLPNGAPAFSCPAAPAGFPCAGGRGNPLNLSFDLNLDILNKTSNSSTALFGQATFALTDAFSVTAGLRWTEDDKKYSAVHRRRVANLLVFPPADLQRQDSNLAPKIGVEYRFSADILTYASWSRGFKSGGFEGRPTFEAAIESFGPETASAFEVGVKTDLLDRRLRFNASVFQTDYDDIQVPFTVADPITRVLGFTTENAAGARVRGFEAEITARVAKPLTLNASIGHIDARYTETDASSPITTATKFARTPAWNYTLGADVRTPIGAGATEFIGNLDYSWRSDQELDTRNCSFVRQPSYGLLSGRVGVADTAGGWQATVYARNLTNERYLDAGTCYPGSFGVGEGYSARPREIGATLRYSF